MAGSVSSEEAGDPVVGVDVGVGVRVEHLPDAVLVEQDAAELGVAVAELPPLLGGELGGFEQRPGVQVGVHRGQRDQVPGVHRGEQCGDLPALGQRLGEGVPAAVEVGAGGGAGEGETAAAELVAELLGVGGQVAEGAELDEGVSGRGGLVQEPEPGHLLRVVGEPDTPRVGCGAEPQVGQARSDRVGDGRHLVAPRRGPVGAAPAGAAPDRAGHRVLLAAKPAILSMFVESTKDGPVSTGFPPPMSLPLDRCSRSESTAR